MNTTSFTKLLSDIKTLAARRRHSSQIKADARGVCFAGSARAKSFEVVLVFGFLLTVVSARASGSATTLPATSIGADRATLNAVIEGSGQGNPYHFQYGTNSSYGATTPDTFPGHAVSLFGTGHYVSMPSRVYFSGDFTVESWVYLAENRTNAVLMNFGNGAASDNVVVYLTDGLSGTPSLRVYDGNGFIPLNAPAPLPVGQWTHLACTLSNQTGRIYVNGVLVTNRTILTPLSVTRNTNYLGFATGPQGNFANAAFDEFRVFGEALPQSTIQAWMKKEMDATHPNWGSAIIQLKFNEANGLTATNSRVPNLNGTLVGGASFTAFAAPISVPVSQLITGLTPGLPYHYRAVMPAITNGTDQTFTTLAPTLDPISDRTNIEDGPVQTVNLTGISANDPNASHTLSVQAVSSDPSIIPFPLVRYTSPNPSGTLYLKPAFDANGMCTITVTVSYPGASFSRSFKVTVTPVNDPPLAGVGTSLSFDGQSASVLVPGAVIPTSEITVEFWQKVTARKDQATFSLGNGLMYANVPWSDGRVYWFFGPDNPNNVLFYTPPVPLTNSWQHFAFVASQSGNYMKIFRNGVEEASKSGMSPLAANTADLLLGAMGSDFFGGQLAEFRVWNVARSAADISLTMHGAISNNTPNLIMYYRFNEGAGSTVLDSASSSTNPDQKGPQNGSLQNAVTWMAAGAGPSEVVFIDEDTPTLLYLPAYDPDSTLTWQNVTVSTGSVSQVSGGLWRYAPPSNYDGPVSLSYTVSDGSLTSTASLALNILGLNDPPTISSVPNQTVQQDTGALTVHFTVNDDETPAWALKVFAVLSDSALAGYTLGTGAVATDRFITFTPTPGQLGTLVVQLVVVDGGNVSATTSFELRIEPRPAFAIVDLGLIPGKAATFGTAINDQGAVAGFAADNNQGQNPVGFLFSGLENGSTMTAVGDLGGGVSQAFGLNNDNTVVGSSLVSGQPRAFLRQSPTALNLGILTGGTNSVATAINASGTVAGFSSITGGKNRAMLVSSGGTMTNLGTLPSPWTAASEAYGINNAGMAVGTTYSSTNGQRRAFFFNGTNLSSLGNMAFDTNSIALGVNNSGQIVGSSTTAERPGLALNFPGTLSDYVIQSNFNDFPDTAATVEFWLNTADQTKTKPSTFSYETTQAPNAFTILNLTNLEVIIRSVQTIQTGISFVDGNWHHLAVSWSSAGGVVTIYKDGAPVFTRNGIASGLTIPSSGTLVMGQEQDSPGGGFDITQAYAGQLDEVRIWNRVRTAAEIQANRNVVLTGSEPGLVRYFRFEEGAGTTIVDQSLSQRNATRTGGVTWVKPLDTGRRLAFLYDSTSTNGMRSLGTLSGGGASEARAINDFGQVAGVAYSSNNTLHATFYSTGTLNDLNDLLSEDDARVWTLTNATAINVNGAVVGTGTSNGQTRAFLALPATVIGQPVIRPLGAVARYPIITLLKTTQPDDAPLNAFYWSEFEKRLYAVRPVTAKIEWFDSFTDSTGSGTDFTVNTNRIVSLTVNVWPRTPTRYIAGAPVEVEPQGMPFAYSYLQVSFATGDGAVEPSSKIFTSSSTGYTVIQYLKNNGQVPNPSTQSPYFEVVRTFAWDNTAYLPPDQAWLIGTAVTNANHFDYLNKNGYVLFKHSPIDATGDDKAYDPNTRLGPILPVNRVNADPLVVVWYATNRIGVAWAGQAIRYSLDWPYDTADQIVIASSLGSGALDPLLYPEMQVYNQPDPTLAGFNPNEEHAFIADSNGGGAQALFALRNDLNGVNNYSAPFALLKYKDPTTLQWQIRPYYVIAEQAPYFFAFTGTAGNAIQPPYPLSLLPLCQQSYGASGPTWKDHNGQLYARAAGPEGSDTNIIVRYFYPLQPGFYFPQTNVDVGDCVAWLERLNPGNPLGQPIDVTYDIHWPIAPVLEIGETLLNPKASAITGNNPGLPAIASQLDAQVVYDDINPFDNAGLLSLARLYDPLSPRTLPVPVSLPSSLRVENIAGKDVFIDLPFALEKRLQYDPINQQLSFKGYLDANFGLGDNPLLLFNVLSERERDRLKALAANASTAERQTWENEMDQLYDLTRNPNQVDLDQNGVPDQALRLGLINSYVALVTNSVSPLDVEVQRFQQFPTAPNLSVFETNVVPQQFGAGPKALTAGLGGLSPAVPRPGKALHLDGLNDYVTVGGATNGATLDFSDTSFTVEFWARRASSGSNHFIFSQGVEANHRGLHIGFRSSDKFAFAFYGDDLNTTQAYADTNWHHWACTYNLDNHQRTILRDGVVQASDNATANYQGFGVPLIGAYVTGGLGLSGEIDEVRVWKSCRAPGDIAANMNKRLLGSEDTLALYYRCDEGTGVTLTDSSGNGFNGTLLNDVAWVDSTAPAGIPPRYLTLAFNNRDGLPGLPVSLQIIRVDDGPFLGDLKVLPSDNVFDERVTVRHNSDFGGDPGSLYFEWYYKPQGPDFDPLLMPQLNADGTIGNPNGWIKMDTEYNGESNGRGFNDVTIGEGSESSLITLSDNGFICRYRGYAVNLFASTNWSGWVGDPSGTPLQPRAALVEGWVKRVIRGLNPFDARTADFHSSAVDTYASMLIQAGARYVGDIAFNPDADAINSVGLIEAYQTVLNRAEKLSINGTPPVDFNPANNALLLAATKISDLYMVLGNEAYADACDPTIGFGTDSSEYGSLASSIFAFENQVASLLEEELALLRGRDDRSAGVTAYPVYNRLFWNFTLGDGEVAYQQTYNISDQNNDGFIDVKDARILYPQGHGDAWGHYLTAIRSHYDLLRHPYFTWIPRTESVDVDGVAVEVDFLDERKFAIAAAAKAKAGSDIVDLTYRLNYVDDPAGQWQGYKDSDPDRAWGVTEWARRAAQGAYFDWVVGNSILPAMDPNTNHVGIQQIDRTTVSELTQIPTEHGEIQSRLDQADAGLNPLGLAKGVVPFDIDPSLIAAGKTHFEQIQDRATKAMANAVAVWNEVNQANQLLRRNQDSVEQFTAKVTDQETDYKNRLIEIFGYPYAGDIGPGQTYPAGYDGPDLYHYMYVNAVDLTGADAPPSATYTALFSKANLGLTTTGNTQSGALGDPNYAFYFPPDNPLGDPGDRLATNILAVTYPTTAADYGFVAPTSYGARRAPGELQAALSELLQNQARVQQALLNYDNLIGKIEDSRDLLQERYNLRADELQIKNELSNIKIGLGVTIAAAKAVEAYTKAQSAAVHKLNDISISFLPNEIGLANDFSGPIRGISKTVEMVTTTALDAVGTVATTVGEAAQAAQTASEGVEAAKIEKSNFSYEISQQVTALEELLRQEAVQRVEVFTMQQVMNESSGRYLAALASGQRLIDERVAFRKRAAAATTQSRYQDMTFRIFRDDALQKYRAQFDLAARYVFLAATAYDYESNLLGTDNRSGRDFLTDIIRQRSLGQMLNGAPVAGRPGLADPLARLSQNFDVLRSQLGFNNPQTETGRFSLRNELFRLTSASSTDWQAELKKHLVSNLWDVPEFRRYCRPFASQSAGPQPGLVIRFPTGINFGENFFGWPLSGGDSAYDPSRFATKIRSVGVWFSDYNGAGLSQTPRVYLVPAGVDFLRAPTGDTLATRQWRVIDQQVPVPFPIGQTAFQDPNFIPIDDSVGGSFAAIRQFASFRAYHDSGSFQQSEVISDSRLIGRSVWNTDWMLIIPGGTLLFDPNQGLDGFINSVSDIKLFFQTYSYAGD